MKNPILFILLTLFTLCAFGFLYTFIQPRYTATIVRVGRSRIITHSTKHGRRSHTIVPLTVTFLDED